MDSLELVLMTVVVLLALTNFVVLIWAMGIEKKLRHRPIPKVYEVNISAEKVFSEIDISDVEKIAKQELEKIVTESAKQMKTMVDASVQGLGTKISDSVDLSLRQELQEYQVSLQGLREQTIDEFSKLQQELDSRKTQLIEQLDKKVVEEYKRRLAVFDERLNDIVASYVVESLGTNVDLGAQMTYIVNALDQHKDDIKRDVLSA